MFGMASNKTYRSKYDNDAFEKLADDRVDHSIYLMMLSIKKLFCFSI
jgi:hypothetical protein